MTRELFIDVLEKIALLLELKRENPFKVRAYRTGAEVVRTLPGDIVELARALTLLSPGGLLHQSTALPRWQAIKQQYRKIFRSDAALRISLKVSGRNFPGRYMNHLQIAGDPPRDAFIDAFDRGKILTEAETTAHLLELIGEVPDAETWQPASQTEVILRMLNNLTANATEAKDDARAIRYLNTAITLDPKVPTRRLQRMLLLAKNGRSALARADAAWLIAEEPPGIDTSRVLELMQSLK